MGHRFLFYLDPANVNGENVCFNRWESHHIGAVLRLPAGSEVEAVDGRGRVYKVRIERRAAGCWCGRIIGCEINEVAAPLPISLAIPCLRGDRWEVALEAACEMGAEAIWLIDYQLATLRWSKARIERAQRKAIEALKQSGGSWLTQVKGPCKLEELLLQTSAHQVYLAEAAGDPLPELAGSILLLIGPEAGIHENETAALRAAQIRCFSLGKRRLRSEIAALSALAQAARMTIKT